jgi:hypothetical protein
MELTTLGSTNVMIPEIGLGTWKYKGGIAPLRQGLDLGAFLIDTAEIYRTEDVVGQAIKDRRAQVFLATKVAGNHLRYDEVLRAAEASLRRLGTDVIDLYQIHWPNPHVPIKDTMRAMEMLVDRGQVRFIGVSNFSLPELRAAQAAMSKYPVVANQVLYNLDCRDIERDLVPYCQAHHVTILAYTPLDDGRLAKKPFLRPSRGLQVLGQVAAEVQKTLAQVALRWCTAHPNVIAIPKSDKVDRTVENCQASGWLLSSEQLRRLDDAFA